MKSCTDIEQSKKLAEILPIESADMCFNISQRNNMSPLMTPYSRFDEFFNISPTPDFLIPCWSLAALLDVLPQRIDDKYGLILGKLSTNNGWYICYNSNVRSIDYTKYYVADSYFIDVCYEMILKLKGKDLI